MASQHNSFDKAGNDDADDNRERSEDPFAATDPMPLPRQAHLSSRDHAAQLLIAPSALMSLSLVEAKIVVSYMHPETVPAGETFITEGDAVNNGFMVLLLDGEVLVENITVSRTKPVTVTVLGPGSLIGEMGLLDTGPRSASCTASTDIQCAVLTRQALESLIEDQPAMGAKFLLAVSARIAERYRETQKKLVLFARLAATMQAELDRQT
jgi:CRP-like cAMP-binding protein